MISVNNMKSGLRVTTLQDLKIRLRQPDFAQPT